MTFDFQRQSEILLIYGFVIFIVIHIYIIYGLLLKNIPGKLIAILLIILSDLIYIVFVGVASHNLNNGIEISIFNFFGSFVNIVEILILIFRPLYKEEKNVIQTRATGMRLTHAGKYIIYIRILVIFFGLISSVFLASLDNASAELSLITLCFVTLPSIVIILSFMKKAKYAKISILLIDSLVLFSTLFYYLNPQDSLVLFLITLVVLIPELVSTIFGKLVVTC